MTESDTYRTIAAPAQGLYKEKGSKFIAYALPVRTTDEVKQNVERLRAEHFDARHHCYAYALGPDGGTWRAVDDGEPSGTAGRPIHGQLLSFGLTDVLVVVVRYFGGILLGASGLAAAYKAAARDALSAAVVEERVVTARYRLAYPYEATADVMRLLRDFGLKPLAMGYDTGCTAEVEVRLSQSDHFAAAAAQVRIGGRGEACVQYERLA